MKKMLCAVALAAASITVSVSAAEAATPRCVTKAEFRHVHAGQSKARVHRNFDTRGRRIAFSQVDGTTSEIRRYRTCRRHSSISIAFSNGRVTVKSALWR